MTTILKEAEANDFDVIYPLRFSERNRSHHAKEVKIDETKEHLFVNIKNLSYSIISFYFNNNFI